MSVIVILLKKITKIFLKTLLAILLLILVLWILLQTSFFQNFLVHRITKTLSKNLHTTVSIRHVDFELFDKMLLEQTLILDLNKDTLLSAGKVRVSLTDWFFFKDKIVLNYVGLEDATILLNRNTPEWNYQFLIDYFGKGTSSGAGKSKPIELDLKIVSLKNVKIFEQDKWRGTDMLASVKNLRLEAEKLDLKNRMLNIRSINMEEPVFSQYEYTGLRPPNNSPKTTDNSEAEVAWNADLWQLIAKNITIKNGKVALEREGGIAAALNEFDERHVILSGLNASLKNTRLTADTLSSEISLSVKDRGGFKIEKLTSHFKLTPHMMEFNDLDLKTGKSHLKDYFAMHYKSFNEDMNDYVHAVKMVGNFKNSIIDSDDLAYFAPDARSWNTIFELDGNITGKVDNLTALDFTIIAGGKNYLHGDVSIRGLPNTDETFVDLRKSEVRTSYSELAKLIPALRSVHQPDLFAFGNIRYRGSFTGYFTDFVAYGEISTSIGNLSTDIHLKVPDKGIASYSGKVSTENFNLGAFINDKSFGRVAFDGKLDGKGFEEKTMDIAIDGKISKIYYNNYGYSNIIAHGEIKKDLFTGSASINDQNIRIDTLIGMINFSKKNPAFNFNADVLTLNLKTLGFTNDSISLTGRFNFDFTGSNIDNFLGTAKVTDAKLYDEGKHLSFDSLLISSTLFDGSKLLSISTNELEATINGNFKILELPQAFQLFLSRYYPAYIKKPIGRIENQNFSFMVHTRDVSEYTNLFYNKLSGFNESVIRGNINIEKNELELQAYIPQVKISNIVFNDIRLNGTGSEDTLRFHSTIDDVVINDSLHSPGTEISIVSSNDISDIDIVTSANKTLNSAHLSAQVQTKNNGFKLSFNPSTFTLNQKQWTIEKDGEIELVDKILMASHLRMYQNGQEIIVSTLPSDLNNSNDVLISLKKITTEDIAPLLFKDPSIRGLLSGNVRIRDPFNKMEIDFNNRIDEFYFEGDSIGVLTAKGAYHAASQSLNAFINSPNELYNFSGNFGYYPLDSLNQLRGEFTLNNSGIHALSGYLAGIVSEIRGRATGTLNLSGKLESPKLTGSISLDSTSLTVDYTQCRYTLVNGSVIKFNPDEIDFGNITLKDVNNQTATLSGKMYHNFFDNFFFNDLHLKTNSVNGAVPHFLLLNTTARDNKEFYGKVIGTAELSLNGFVTDMRMSIRGEPTDSSHIYLPINETAESGSLDYIDFIKFGREMTVDTRARENTNIKVEMELTANPLVKIDVILDETTGDVIKAQGSGKLFISAGTSDPLTIRGRYNIEEGEYTFNFQTFLKTPFILQQGYIEWQGDPYLALVNIDAIYRARNVNLSNIPTSTGFSNTKGDIDIIFKLRGTLKNPSPTFEFQFPFDNPLKSDPIANEYLKTRFQSDNNQLLNQVASLLLFNTFMTTDQGLLTGNNTGNFVTKTVGQLLSATLTTSLNNWLQKLLKTNSVNLYTNINTADFNFQKGVTQNEIQSDFGLRTSFWNNKLQVNVGGNLDYKLNPALSNSNSNFLFTPDVSFELLISPEGNLRVIGFNRSDADPGDIAGITRRNRTGIQLSYRKDFDTFEEFFTKSKKKK